MTDVTSPAVTEPGQVWVGVDGSPGSDAAVRFGARAAAAYDVGLHLTHVIALHVPLASALPIVPEDLESTGRRILDRAAASAADVLAPDRISTSMLRGGRVASLVDASASARLLVLGRAGSVVDRLFTGSAATGVSARSAGSVVVVPAGWQPREGRFHVVAGLKSPEHSEDLALHAMRLAADRGGRVTFVHAWELGTEYDDLISSRVADPEWSHHHAHAVVATCLRDVVALYGEVPVDVRVVHGQPARVLQQESADADVLLLARRGRVLPRGHLGGTARALLREAGCAVEVAPPADGPRDPADATPAGTAVLVP